MRSSSDYNVFWLLILLIEKFIFICLDITFVYYLFFFKYKNLKPAFDCNSVWLENFYERLISVLISELFYSRIFILLGKKNSTCSFLSVGRKKFHKLFEVHLNVNTGVTVATLWNKLPQWKSHSTCQKWVREEKSIPLDFSLNLPLLFLSFSFTFFCLIFSFCSTITIVAVFQPQLSVTLAIVSLSLSLVFTFFST